MLIDTYSDGRSPCGGYHLALERGTIPAMAITTILIDRRAVGDAKMDFKRGSCQCRKPDLQLSSIEQVCNSSLDPLSMVEDFYIEHRYSRPV